MHTSVAVSETNSNKHDIQIKNNTQPTGCVLLFLHDSGLPRYKQKSYLFFRP